MPRRSVSAHRRDVRDARYRDPLAGRFINCMLLRGKKSLAARTFYQAIDFLEGKGEGEPIEMFRKAVENIKPIRRTTTIISRSVNPRCGGIRADASLADIQR